MKLNEKSSHQSRFWCFLFDIQDSVISDKRIPNRATEADTGDTHLSYE